MFGEGNETLVLEMLDVIGGTLGDLTSSRIIIEDNAIAPDCTEPVLLRYAYSNGADGIEPIYSNNTVDLFDGALLAVGNSCVDRVRYRLEGSADFSEAVINSVDEATGERYFVIANPTERNVETSAYFTSAGGRNCSSINEYCHQRIVEASPVGGSGTIRREITATFGIFNDFNCAVSAEERERLLGSLTRNPDARRSGDKRYELGAPFIALNIGSEGNREKLKSGQTHALKIMQKVERIGTQPQAREMGVFIYREPNRGSSLSSSRGGPDWNFAVQGTWFNADNSGTIYYTPEATSRTDNDKFYYVIAPPVANRSGGLLYNPCINSKGQAFIEVLPSSTDTTQPPTVSRCVYPGGDTSKRGRDDIAKESCPPTVTPTNSCVYPGGDTSKWGWNNIDKVSCPPIENNSQPPELVKPTVESNSCVYPGGDTSKWGWDNIARESCAPLDSSVALSPADPSVAASCTYPGGDTSKWGWDNVARQSCAPVDSSTAPPPADTPVAVNCIYPGGDTSQWGWDNVARKSCPPSSAGVTYLVSPPPAASGCVYPGGDTSLWGWNNATRQSCPPF